MPALPLDKACDFSFGLPPTRFIHGIKNRGHSIKNDVRDALESAALLCEHVALRRVFAAVRARTLFILCVGHGFSIRFSSECGDKSPLRAHPYSGQRWERSPSHGCLVIGQINCGSQSSSLFMILLQSPFNVGTLPPPIWAGPPASSLWGQQL